MISLKLSKVNNKKIKEISIPKVFPGISSYTKIKVLGFCPAVKMDNTNNIYICNTWQYKPLIPILISLCGIFFLIMSSIFLFPHFGFEGKVANCISILFLILFFIAYFQTIFIGPGFFPFFWSEQQNNHCNEQLNQGMKFKSVQNEQDQMKEDEFIQTQASDNLNVVDDNLNYDLESHDDNSPSGIITKQEQLFWAKSKQRPPRSVISKEAERIVIRPDHYCGVTLSWIGKRNQKFFILFNLYAAFFSFTLSFYSLRLVARQIYTKGWCWHFDFLLALVMIVVGFQFGGLSLSFGLVSLYHAFIGRTMLEDQMNVNNKFDKGCKKNLEDICGSCSTLPCWLCPTNPWKSKTNEELVKDYVSYYDDSLFTNTN